MTGVDYAIVAVITLSAVISVVRGFVREALSLLGWIVAFWLSLTFTDSVAQTLAGQISAPRIRTAVAFLAIFVPTLFVAGAINFLAGKLVEKTGLTGTDRMVGIVFGVVRGGVIVSVLVLVAGFLGLAQESWWHESMLMKHFVAVAMEIRDLLPADVAAATKL